MKKQCFKLIVSSIFMVFALNAVSREKVGGAGNSNTASSNNSAKSVNAQCQNATAQIDLDINNVRAKILNGGDMWWDIFASTNARYQVPKPASASTIGPSSQFASSVWVGGYDAGGQLKVAAQTYRQQGGNDYWPGPLKLDATTDAGRCLLWDKFYKINRKDVQTYFDWCNNGNVGPNPLLSYSTLPDAMDNINNWPAFGPEGQALAPFYDYNGDGQYDPSNCDVPDFDVTGKRGCNAQLYGDQCIFWVFNDKGGIHTETGGDAIGLEVQAQAFAFQSNDEINNATFYKYKLINRGSFQLDSTYFGLWDDADLGDYSDDYVGCDVGLGLGILYNGDAQDGTGQTTAYGFNPPAIGVDFFEGPKKDANGIDDPVNSVPASFLNYGNATSASDLIHIDDERLGMCRFMYFNNDGSSVNGNPSSTDDYYQYLCGYWKNGTPITYGGNGTSGSVPCAYMFPGSSDIPSFFGTNGVIVPPWDEVTAGNTPADRRFIESAGPFTLMPGAVNYITIGVPWARATSGGPLASVARLKEADAKVQELFNNCFATLNGPDAPNLTIQELDKELILYWSNPKGSNNNWRDSLGNYHDEGYVEDYDKSSGADSVYRFQGYMVYQLKDASVGATDLYNVDKARLIFQCDKKDKDNPNGAAQIINYTLDGAITALIPQEMVSGADNGIVHSISVKTDKFATGTDALINHKTYYYAIVAYGYTPTRVPTNLNFLRDYKPFIAGRNYSDPTFYHTAIPHIPSPEANGTTAQCPYGSGPKLTRIEGQGNGGNILDFTSSTIDEIMSSSSGYRSIHPTYENGHGPVTIKVIDPLNVPENTNFRVIIKRVEESLAIGKFRINAATSGSVQVSVNGVVIGSANWAGDSISTAIALAANINSTISSPDYSASSTGAIVTIHAVQGSGSSPNGRAITFVTTGDATATALSTMHGGVSLSTSISPNSTWVLKNMSTGDSVISDATIEIPNEQIINGQNSGLATASIPKWGISVSVAYTLNPGVGTPNNGFIEATMTFADNTKQWLGGIEDADGIDYHNWIRSGTFIGSSSDPKGFNDEVGQDDQQYYEKLINGTWSPYRLAASIVPTTGTNPVIYSGGPALENSSAKGVAQMKLLASTDVILTSDRSKWTRCPVIEMQEASGLAVGNATKLKMRASPSVDKNGTPNYPSADNNDFPTGMGWFPGYAINLETGERMNMAFGEDSWLVSEHGRDMIWNPTSIDMSFLNGNPTPIFGGKHYIYVFGHSENKFFSADVHFGNGSKSMPRYDGGAFAHNLLEVANTTVVSGANTDLYARIVYGSAMWVSIPLLVPGHQLLETDVKIRLRVAKSYMYGYAGSILPVVDTALNPVNRNLPMYDFNTADIGTKTNNADAAANALDLINVVPNPYYAYSGYEQSADKSIVKITNLPEKCSVTIYTLNGTLVRAFKVDQPSYARDKMGVAVTSLDWDLKNQVRIPVSSGLYIIHVEVPDVGEKTIKWFGVMRPLDLEAY